MCCFNDKNIEIKILNELIGDKISLPSYATDGSAGMDINACINEPIEIKPKSSLLVNSGFAIYINDKSLMGIIVPRSGLSSKHGIILSNTIGIIDSDYQ